MSRSKDTAAIVTYGDHEVIVPENKLRGAVSKDTPMQAAKIRWLAPKRHSPNSLPNSPTGWIPSANGSISPAATCSRMATPRPTRRRCSARRMTSRVKPQRSATPRWHPPANSLCRLIEHTPADSRIPLKLIDQHVDAVRAIYREYARSDAKELAATLTKRLRDVTDEFLIQENHDRPEVLEQLKGPSIVPE